MLLKRDKRLLSRLRHVKVEPVIIPYDVDSFLYCVAGLLIKTDLGEKLYLIRINDFEILIIYPNDNQHFLFNICEINFHRSITLRGIKNEMFKFVQGNITDISNFGLTKDIKNVVGTFLRKERAHYEVYANLLGVM